MTRTETRILTALTVLVLVGIGFLFTTGCTAQAQYPAQLMFKSCQQAGAAGVPLPVGIADPGFNPELDRNNDGVMC